MIPWDTDSPILKIIKAISGHRLSNPTETFHLRDSVAQTAPKPNTLDADSGHLSDVWDLEIPTTHRRNKTPTGSSKEFMAVKPETKTSKQLNALTPRTQTARDLILQSLAPRTKSLRVETSDPGIKNPK